MTDPAIGDIGLVKIHGTVGFLIRFGQWLCGGGFADYEHAVVCVDVLSNGLFEVIQAEPGGATWGYYSAEDKVLWSHFPLTDDQRAAIVHAATGYKGTPYSFLDYVAIALHSYHLPIPGLKRYIQSTKHMICSQLVDKCYQDVGVQLFSDERWPGFCTPSDLYQLIR